MKKSDLAQDLARRSGVKPADAADRVDQAVNRVIRALKSGQTAHLPGLGTISPGKPWVFRPESDER